MYLLVPSGDERNRHKEGNPMTDNTPTYPRCDSRSGGVPLTKGQPFNRPDDKPGQGWYCSLQPDHDGDHQAYDLNVVKPGNFIAAWGA
jgi:hypothetical protein